MKVFQRKKKKFFSMKASATKSNLHWIYKILFGINVLNSVLLLGAYLNTHVSPNDFSYLYFLGLGYPILLIIELVFLFAWLLFRKKFALLSFCILIIGFNHLRHFFAITLFQPTIEQPLKVISFNVHIFDLYNLEHREENKQEIFKFLKEQDADVYCFQEFYHQDQSSNFQTKNEMIPILGTPHYHERYTHEMLDKKFFGVATFSKYPIINQVEIPFDNDPNNYCIYSDILREDDTIRVFNAHIGSIRLQSDDYDFFENGSDQANQENKEAGQRILGRLKNAFEKRAIQAEKIAAQIEISPYPTVLCGDLNDTPVSYCYRQFSRQLYDAFVESGNGVGQTYIGKVPSNRIDYIFYSEHFESANFITHQVNLSDHKPISVELGIIN